jgi:chromate transport protein ChrA
MRYVLPGIVMLMAILMIVCTREESIKYGTMIFGVCIVWIFILNKMGTKKPKLELI